jgi:hypothetical protein
MIKIKELLEKYGFQYHRTYQEDGIELLCFYDKDWKANPDGSWNPATYFIHLTNKHISVFNCPEEQGFLKRLHHIKYDESKLDKIEKMLIKLL